MENYSTELKKLIKIKKTPNKPFNERLIFYKQCFEDYKKWRLSFKFPKTDYMSRIKTLKPAPSGELVKNLGVSISELREGYIQLKGYKQMIIFKLFLFYFAETFKAKNKIKINKSVSGPFSGRITGGKSPTRRDIDTIIDAIDNDHFQFENSFSDRYQKTKPGHKRKSGDVVGTSWDWVKNKNFKWNSKWKPFNKKYGHQNNFAKKDHYTISKDERSLRVTNKMIKEYETLIKEKKAKDSIAITNLFYELTYCKNFEKIDEIFDTNIIQKSTYKKSSLNWQRLNSEKYPEVDRKDRDVEIEMKLDEKFKKRVFPQFTFKNIKSKFNLSKFLAEIINTKSIKLSIIRAIDGDDELYDGIDYHELLPEFDLILPAFTSGAIFNLLDNDLSFITVARFQTLIPGLGESIEIAYGILKSKKNSKYFFVHYHHDRDGTTYCDLVCELNESDCLKIPLKKISTIINGFISSFDIPDRITLNKDYKWNFDEIKKVINRSVNEKIESALEDFDDFVPWDKNKGGYTNEEYLESWKKEQEYKEALIGCRIYLLSQKEINIDTDAGKGTGSVRVSLDGKINKGNLVERKPYIIFNKKN